MDFSRVELADDDQRFQAELRDFLARHVTEDVHRRDRESGDNFDEAVHLALGAAGYLEKDFKSEVRGGWNALRRRIWELEIGRARTPWFHWGTTGMVAHSVEQFAAEELSNEVMPGVLSGEIRLCLGYTEPEGGSDVATCKTRAVREADGSSWVINGAKMFTSNAQHSQYVFLLTNTDPDAPKHQSLTMFLVPLDTEGIEIQGIRTVDGDRTNIVYYSDVRVDDRYRIGEVNGGWTVLRAALNLEHGTVERDTQGLQKLATMTEQALLTAEGVDRAVAEAAKPGADGRCRLDDESVQHRLGRSIARLEVALSTSAEFGRVAIAQMMRDITPDLMDVLGGAAALPVDAPATVADGALEYLYRLASPVAIYGGTVEVFRNMIAQHALGLGRPNYSAPVGK